MITFQPTIHELKTPLAFSIVAHSHLGLLEAQLATIFRPNNAYCIFVDSKAIHTFKNAVSQLVDCYREKFPSTQIFLVANAFPVFWADISLLKVCWHSAVFVNPVKLLLCTYRLMFCVSKSYCKGTNHGNIS